MILDNESLKYMNLFRKITGVEALDCLIQDNAYFLVEEGKAGLAVGTAGRNVKKLRNLIRKRPIVLELIDDPIKFTKSLLAPIGLDGVKIELNDKTLIIQANSKKKGRIIGRDGSNIKMIRKLLKRHFDLEEIKVK